MARTVDHNGLFERAKKAKNDEFYTRYEDIAKEMAFWEDDLRGKHIFCNCDDYRWSNFVKFFKDNFQRLGLKKTIVLLHRQW